MNETTRYGLSFRLGQQWYGIDVSQIVEVLYLLEMAELPGSEAHFLGLMTLREKIVPVIDLRVYYQVSEAPLQLNTPIIVVRQSNGLVGLVVDEFDNVEYITPEHLMAYDGPLFTKICIYSRRGAKMG